MSHNLGQHFQGLQEALGTQGPFLSWDSRMAPLYKVDDEWLLSLQQGRLRKSSYKESCRFSYFNVCFKDRLSCSPG